MKKHYLTLDLMRGLAALAVATFHVTGTAIAGGNVSVVPGGYLAVDLFFVISGFVVCKTYEPRFNPGYGDFDYLKARIIRLYPLYFAGLVISVALSAMAILRGYADWSTWSLGKLAVSTICGVLFLPTPPIAANAGEFSLYPWDVPFWSLLMELIASFAFVALRRWSYRAIGVLAMVSLGALALAVGLHGNANLGAHWPTFGGGLARAAFSFSVGILLTRAKPPTWRGAPWLCALAIACLFLPVPTAFRPAFDLLCIAAIFPAAVWAAVGCEPPLRKLAAFLGGTSYALYALHEPVLRIIGGAIKILHAKPPGSVLAIAIVGASVAVAAAAHRFYDEPVRRWLSRLSRSAVGARRQAPAPQSAQL